MYKYNDKGHFICSNLTAQFTSNGERTQNRHLCYSNKRKLFVELFYDNTCQMNFQWKENGIGTQTSIYIYHYIALNTK
jgi:hypothetical protein